MGRRQGGHQDVPGPEADQGGEDKGSGIHRAGGVLLGKAPPVPPRRPQKALGAGPQGGAQVSKTGRGNGSRRREETKRLKIGTG